MMRIIYKGKFSTMYEASARTKSGKRYLYTVSIGKPVVVILPLLDDGRIILERQYRHAIRSWIYEIPAGHVERGEGFIEAARRELLEETGYMASRLKFLLKSYQSPSAVRLPQRMFLATGLKKGRTRLEDSERISLRKVSLEAAVSMIEKNKIMDMKTITTILFYYFIARKKRVRSSAASSAPRRRR